MSVAPGNFLDWRASAASFDGMSAYTMRTLTLAGDAPGSEPRRIMGNQMQRDQSLGADEPRWTPRVLVFGRVVAVLIAAGFIVIALWAYFAGGSRA